MSLTVPMNNSKDEIYKMLMARNLSFCHHITVIYKVIKQGDSVFAGLEFVPPALKVITPL